MEITGASPFSLEVQELIVQDQVEDRKTFFQVTDNGAARLGLVQIAMGIVAQVAEVTREQVQMEPDQHVHMRIIQLHVKTAEIVPVNRRDLPELNATIHPPHQQVHLGAATPVVSQKQDQAEAEEFVNIEPNETKIYIDHSGHSG